MDFLLYFFIALIALLYAAVGHGGATGYLALMSIAGLEPMVMASTALVLNCIAAGISTVAYAKQGCLSLPLTLPFLVFSIPAAYFGASANLSEEQYGLLLSAILIISALKLLFFKSSDQSEEKFVRTPNFFITGAVGAILGFLAGAVGIGGGVFLSPLVILLGWADPKTTSGCAALFIVCNSVTGLIARQLQGRIAFDSLLPFLIAVFIGALIGALYGSKYSSAKKLRHLIAIVLLLAAFKTFL